MSTALKATANGIIAEIDAAELACRIAEKALGLRRPNGKTGRETISSLEPEDQAKWLGAAETAMLYVVECIDRAKTPN